LADLSNFGSAVRLYSERRTTGPPEDHYRRKHDVIFGCYSPNDYDPSLEDEAMGRDIDALNYEMKAAGVRIFVGGLQLPPSAKSLRAQPDGKVLITDGPYLETKEHVGGFWVLEAADLNEALAWGARPLSPVGAGRGAPF